MKKIFFKFLFSIFIFSFLFISALVPVFFASADPDFGEGIIQDNIGLSDKSPIEIAAKLINNILIILSILAVALVIFAGFKWMTAAGNDEEITKAKKLLSSGVIGLIIILSAWGISLFIMEIIVSSSGTRIISMP